MEQYTFHSMTQQEAEEIAAWQYEGDYSFYNMDEDPEDLQEFLDSEKRGDSYFVVCSDKELVGFYGFSRVATDIIDIALGVKPVYTGKGKGVTFLEAGLAFVKLNYQPAVITLSVAAFNERAIRVYKKVGFQDETSFMQKTNGSEFEFIRMKLV